MVQSVYDVAIIGSGPAAFTAAIYTTRGAAKTLILGGSKWGGQLMLTTEVENFPGFPSILGPELMEKMKGHATKFGAVFVAADVEEVDFAPPTGPLRREASGVFTLKAGGQEYKVASVIIATGASARWLGLPSEQKYIGRGVSSCAPCDAPFFKDKNVIVAGGGDSAIEEALVLIKYATTVTIVHRRDSFRASKIMQQRALTNPKIKVMWDTVVEEVMGNEKVTGVKLKNVKTNQITELPIDGVFVAVGHDPATNLLTGKVQLDEKGYVKIVTHDKYNTSNEEGKVIGNKFSTMTSVEGVFVAGDVHDFHYRQAITAAGFGCQAAMDALAWLDDLRSRETSGPAEVRVGA